MLNSSLVLFVIVLFLNLFLGVVVLYKGRQTKVNRAFFALTILFSIWIIASFLEDEIKNPNVLLLLIKIDYISAFLAIACFSLFCFRLSEIELKKNKLNKLLVFGAYSVPIIFSFLVAFTKYIVVGFEELPGGLDPILGGGEIYFDIFLVFYLILGLLLLRNKYRIGDSLKKGQILYVSLGLFIFLFIALLTNVALVDIIKNSSNYTLYSRFGIFSSMFFILFSGYAIIKHRLLDLKIITTELLSVGILVFSLFQVLRSQNAFELAVNSVVFIILLSFIAMLVRSVENEVKRKDELQMMSDKLAEANDQLRKLDNTKSEFISIASHQLRTPLTAIKGFISLLLEGSYGKINAKQEDALNKVYTSNDRLVTLVEDLLNVSRIESGRMEFKLVPTKIEDICQEVADTLMMKAKGRKLYLDYQLPKTPLPELVIDGTKVREVISNMVDNAVKYTEKGGVTLRTEKTPDAVRVIVADTGIGIPKEELPYLFSKFSRGKDTARLNTGGTGLGLYVGKAMVEQNGGKIWAESEGAGKGSRFIIELPIKQDEELLKRWGNQS